MQHQHKAERNPFTLSGILVCVTIVVGLILPEATTLTLLALVLFGIACIYVGFAVADGRAKALIIEAVVALFYLALVYLGMTISTWILVFGYVLHGFWDWLHHNRDFSAEVVSWYIPLCVIYDWVIALFIAILIMT